GVLPQPSAPTWLRLYGCRGTAELAERSSNAGAACASTSRRACSSSPARRATRRTAGTGTPSGLRCRRCRSRAGESRQRAPEPPPGSRTSVSDSASASASVPRRAEAQVGAANAAGDEAVGRRVERDVAGARRMEQVEERAAQLAPRKRAAELDPVA